MTSGQKRSWEGTESDANKRPREKGDERDWRDVHLKSGPRRQTLKTPAYDRKSLGRDDNRRGNEGRNRSRRDSDLRHSKGSSVKYERESTGRDDHRLRSGSRELAFEEEKEEGEISPRGTPFSEPVSDLQKGLAAVSTQETGKDIAQRKPNEPEFELELPPSPPPVEDILAARRARRQAILAKFAGPASVATSVCSSPGPSSAVQPPTPSSSISNFISQTRGSTVDLETQKESKQMSIEPPGRRNSPSASPTPQEFALAKEDESEQGAQLEQTGGFQVSAADYDPSLDRREDERRRFGVGARDESLGDVQDEEVEGVSEDDEEDFDDMFAIATTEKKSKKVKKLKPTAAPALITTATLDTAADPEGYYSVILGEQLDGGNYQVFSSLGKGMFANVVRARILQPDAGDAGREVAIKIIRCQESMYRAGQKEAQILNKLKQADPEDKKHIIRLERTFEHRGHLCLVFESMSMNLRDVVKRFGKDVGLNLRAVRAYAHQLFLALSLLRKLNIMHADIKPDNILVNEQKTLLKLCDLGSASDASDNEITPYLVSRFYRAPEIILGIPYDPALDIWSIGCTLYELYTGKILFPGRSNNQMLLLMMELKGRFNTKMIKKAKFGDVYFDDMGGFESMEKDRITGADVVRKIHVSKPNRDLKARLMPPTSAKIADDENKMIVSFIDLLDKCLALDPSRRITPREALTHPFIRG